MTSCKTVKLTLFMTHLQTRGRLPHTAVFSVVTISYYYNTVCQNSCFSQITPRFRKNGLSLEMVVDTHNSKNITINYDTKMNVNQYFFQNLISVIIVILHYILLHV